MIDDVAQLRDRITFQARVNGQDAYGGILEEYENVIVDLPSQVRDVRGSEYYESAAQLMERVIVVTIRTRTDLKESMRILYGGEAYQIIHLPTAGLTRNRRFMEIRACLRKGEGA